MEQLFGSPECGQISSGKALEQKGRANLEWRGMWNRKGGQVYSLRESGISNQDGGGVFTVCSYAGMQCPPWLAQPDAYYERGTRDRS